MIRKYRPQSIAGARRLRSVSLPLETPRVQRTLQPNGIGDRTLRLHASRHGAIPVQALERTGEIRVKSASNANPLRIGRSEDSGTYGNAALRQREDPTAAIPFVRLHATRKESARAHKANRTIQEHISPTERRHDFEDIAKGADCVNALHVRS